MGIGKRNFVTFIDYNGQLSITDNTKFYLTFYIDLHKVRNPEDEIPF